MKKTLALVVFLLALAASAIAEPGDPPGCPWEHMPFAQVMRLEELRQAQIVGGVKGSPYWLWQAYLGSGSLSLRLYEVEEPIFPKQLLFKERVEYQSDGGKAMTLTIRPETERVELRIDMQALDLLDRAGIVSIAVKNGAGDEVCAYACEDVRAVMDFFQLAEGETICLQGEDAPVYAYSADGVRRVLTAGN